MREFLTILVCSCLLFPLACDKDMGLDPADLRLVRVSGDSQTAPPRSALPESLVVMVTDRKGRPQDGITVLFSLPAAGTRGARLTVESTATDARGRAATSLLLGDTGEYQVTAQILGGSQPVTFVATARAVSSSPVVHITTASGSVTPLRANDSVSLIGQAIDAEDGTLTGPSLVWSSSLSGRLGEGERLQVTLPAGEQIITLTATDRSGATGTDSRTLTVLGNTAPVVRITGISGAGAQIHAGDLVSFAGQATDAEDGVLTGASLVWTSSLDGRLGEGERIQARLSPGAQQITLTATDRNGAAGSHTRIEIVIARTGPVVRIVSVTGAGLTHHAGEELSFSGTAVEATGTALPDTCLRWTSSLDGDVGRGAGLRHVLSAGAHTLTLTATDNQGTTGRDTLTVLVLPNTAPTVRITGISGSWAQLRTGELVSFAGQAADAEDGDLTGSSLVWTSSLDGRLGEGNRIQARLSPGIHTITLTATDQYGASVTDTRVEVVLAGPPPLVRIIDITGTTSQLRAGEQVAFTGVAVDTSAQDLPGSSLTWTSSLEGLLGSGASLRHALSAGVHAITFSGSDSQGITASDTRTVTVLPNASPVVRITGISGVGAQIQAGELVSFAGEATDAEDGVLTGPSLVWSSSLDGRLGEGERIQTRLSPGTQEITLTATDRSGATARHTRVEVVLAGQPPVVRIIGITGSGSVLHAGEELTFTGTATDAGTGAALPDSALVWTSSLDGVLGRGSSLQARLTAGEHTIILSVADGRGTPASATRSANVSAQTGITRVSIDGGTAELAGEVTVVFPPDAFRQEAEVTIQRADGAAPAQSEAISPIYRIEATTELQDVAQITLATREDVPADQDAYAAYWDGEDWIRLPSLAAADGKTVTCAVGHLSLFQLAAEPQTTLPSECYLTVPYYSQARTGWCAPTAATMLMKAYKVDSEVPDTKRAVNPDNPGGVSRDAFKELGRYVGAMAQASLRYAEWRFGLWPFLGEEAFVRDFGQYVRKQLAAERPIMLAFTSFEGKAGHVVVLVGCSADSVYIHDPSGYFLESCGLAYDSNHLARQGVAWRTFTDFLFGHRLEAQVTGAPQVYTVSLAKAVGDLAPVTLQVFGEDRYAEESKDRGIRELQFRTDGSRGWKDIYLAWDRLAPLGFAYLTDNDDDPYHPADPLYGAVASEHDYLRLQIRVHNASAEPQTDLLAIARVIPGADATGASTASTIDEVTRSFDLSPNATNQPVALWGDPNRYSSVEDALPLATYGEGEYTILVEVRDVAGATADQIRIPFKLRHAGPVLSVNPGSIGVSGEMQETQVSLTSTGTSTLTWTIRETEPWLHLTSPQGSTAASGELSGTGEARLTLVTDGTGLTAGTYDATVQIRSNGGDVDVAVRMTVTAAAPALSVTPAAVVVGSGSNRIQVTLRNTGSGILSWTVREDAAWLHVTSPQGSTATNGEFAGTGDITLTVITESMGLADGVYETTIQIRSNSGNLDLPVRMNLVGSSSSAGESRSFTLADTTTMEFAWVPPGSYYMGTSEEEEKELRRRGWWADRYENERPAHVVTISRGFWLATSELTQQQWRAGIKTTPWADQYLQTDARNPAVGISWDDAQELVHVLNQAVGDSVYRLPTEAEWEYACRAGTTSLWCFGSDYASLDDYAWFEENANRWNGSGLSYEVRPTGTRRPNLWGIWDMHGNVAEWVQDWAGDYEGGLQIDPCGPLIGAGRVLRGGSCRSTAEATRSAWRSSGDPKTRSPYSGIRLLRISDTSPASGIPILSVSPCTLSVGGGLQEATVVLANAGTGILTWTISEAEDWLTVNSSQGTTARDGAFSGAGSIALTITADGTELDEWSYVGTVQIRSNGGDQRVSLRMTVGDDREGAPGEVRTSPLTNGASMQFVWVPEGTFIMGALDTEPGYWEGEGPQHEVTLSHGYWIGRYEVTQEQWRDVMADPQASSSGLSGGIVFADNRPAANVSWYAAQSFVSKLNTAVGDSLYRLPSEAEWEYACRAGTTGPWSLPDGQQLDDYMWYRSNAWDMGLVNAQPVGTKLPNAWGLYDMHGNLGEWVQDWWSSYTQTPQTDPHGPVEPGGYILRGGTFWYAASSSRSSSRSGPADPNGSSGGTGFRLVRRR